MDMNTYCCCFSCSSSCLWRRISLATLPPPARTASPILTSCSLAARAFALFHAWRVRSFSYEAIQTTVTYLIPILKNTKTKNLVLLSKYKLAVDFSEVESTGINTHSSPVVLRCRKLWLGRGDTLPS